MVGRRERGGGLGSPKGGPTKVAKERILLGWKKSNYARVYCWFRKIVWWGTSKRQVCFGRELLNTTMKTAQMEYGPCEVWRRSGV